jgi:hypothetical protein
MIILVVSFMAGSAPVARAQAPTLFGATAMADAAPAAHAAFVARSRLVTVNMGLLVQNGRALDASAVREVGLNLFPDASYTGVVTGFTNYDANTHSWNGTLKDVPGGYFYLTTSGDAFMAHVASSKGVYEVAFAGGNLYRVVQIDQSKFVDEPDDGHDIAANPAPAAAAADVRGDSRARIDVMVVYTPAARAGAGSAAALKAAIALAMTETNTAYANAGVTTRLRLVHTQEVSYTDTGNIGTDLNRLVNPSDGFMDNVPGMRNQFGADMVSLVVENGGAYCGLANAIMATAASAYDVVARPGCMTGYYSFGHEFGHLQGARHDRYVDSFMTPYAYGHGYVYKPARWRTVMAYNNACSDFGFNCTRLQYFSNNAKLYGGVAMGTLAYERNYSVLNTTALTVANFRAQVIGENFSSSFNGSSLGWSPVNGAWSITSGAYYTSAGAANLGVSAKHLSKYGDLTYTARMKRTGLCTTCANRIIIRGNPLSLDPTKWWKPSYVFQYTTAGSFSVYYANAAGTATALKPWTTSAAIVKGANWNTLKVVAVGSTLRFYINNTLVWAGANAALTTGQVGVGFYRDPSAGTLYVDSATLSNTPTAADVLPADIAPGVVLRGGTLNKAP